jgi:enoyl-[acyl-carrier protein] reductase I
MAEGGHSFSQMVPLPMNDAEPAPSIPKGTLMVGKRGLIMGVANDRSIAWGIAQAIAAQGGEVAFTYQGEALEKRVRPLAESLGSSLVVPCDVADDADMDAAFGAVEQAWGGLDFLVHAIGFADKQYLRGRYLDTPRDAFLQAMDISCYSFVAVGRRAAALMKPGGAQLTLSYLGAERVTPHYNVMGVAKAALEASVRYMATDLGEAGIRVNAISAGPIKTLAASGIGDFRYILKWNQYNSPLRRNVTIEEVGGAGLYLLSELSAGVTGEVHHVDSGYHIVGMKNPDAPDISTV